MDAESPSGSQTVIETDSMTVGTTPNLIMLENQRFLPSSTSFLTRYWLKIADLRSTQEVLKRNTTLKPIYPFDVVGTTINFIRYCIYLLIKIIIGF
jgi:hypothetical protein